MIESPDLREAALDWLVRTNDPEFDGWDEFTAWLEASPANADAYHRLAASEAEMLPLVEATGAGKPAQTSPDRRIGQRRLAAAASVAIFVAASDGRRRSATDASRTFDRGGRDSDDRPRRAGSAGDERRHPD